MKIRDFFLPKIAHSDPKVRLKAVADVKDTALLKQISEKDSDAGVRLFAQKRIKELELESA
jgi:hypothetical protein